MAFYLLKVGTCHCLLVGTSRPCFCITEPHPPSSSQTFPPLHALNNPNQFCGGRPLFLTSVTTRLDMSLILNAIAFLPQELLAKFTGSPRKCFRCKSPYGVYGILHGVALPCGFIVGECTKCYASVGCHGSTDAQGKQRRRKCTLRDLSSAEITCPYVSYCFLF